MIRPTIRPIPLPRFYSALVTSMAYASTVYIQSPIYQSFKRVLKILIKSSFATSSCFYTYIFLLPGTLYLVLNFHSFDFSRGTVGL